MKEIIENPVLAGPKQYLQNVAVDNVIFGYHEKKLKVLLLRPEGIKKWVLPGGYIKRIETIEEAAKRVAHEMTGLKNLFLKQFQAFGRPDRNTDTDFTPELLSKLSQ